MSGQQEQMVEVASPVSGAWTAVCAYDALTPGRGVAALVEGRQVAVFRDRSGRVYALSNEDPFSGAYVLSRGIVGSRAGVPVVASPMYKQAFCLRTGVCLDEDGVSVEAYATRLVAARQLVTANT